MSSLARLGAALLLLTTGGCSVLKILGRNFESFGSTPAIVRHKVPVPVRSDVRLSVLWVGHATALIQMDDVVILTDPVLTDTVGQFSKRLVEPGIDVDSLPQVDLVAISHNHIDHLSYGTLDLLESRIRRVVVPEGGLVYMPNYRFPIAEVPTWDSVDIDGLRVTSAPVDHAGYRYGADDAWTDAGATAWVFEYNGQTVYFGGDTAYLRDLFTATAARFPSIEVALLPIAPIEPAASARWSHLDGVQALQAFVDLRADNMVPIHFDTFPHGADAIGDAATRLRDAMKQTEISPERIHILNIGEQRVFASKRSREREPRLARRNIDQ